MSSSFNIETSVKNTLFIEIEDKPCKKIKCTAYNDAIISINNVTIYNKLKDFIKKIMILLCGLKN